MTFLSLFAVANDPGVQVTMSGGGSAAVKVFLLLTALSFASAAVISLSSFTRIVIVLSFLRQALGTPQLPPNQVVIGLALALSAFVMAPTATRVYSESLGPYLDDQIDHEEAMSRAAGPLREFMLRQTREADLRLFFDVSRVERPNTGDELPMSIVVPAFMISELTTAFRMGVYLYVPLLLIDLLVSAILLSLGMMMVPPTLVALPIKVGIFLLADGWQLVAGSLIRSF
ncbi:MAG TPA: flagellar type III secretion system pore protein FliP [Vulgatibacter sp.]|nr:flagellar type III secretion system pore protein FliP [Vulgatibacter sp.]